MRTESGSTINQYSKQATPAPSASDEDADMHGEDDDSGKERADENHAFSDTLNGLATQMSIRAPIVRQRDEQSIDPGGENEVCDRW